LWFALVRGFSTIYLLKVGWREAVTRKAANGRKMSACQLPMIREYVVNFHGSKQRVFARDIRKRVDVLVYGEFCDRLGPWSSVTAGSEAYPRMRYVERSL
jgi:hypothetical protein